MNNRIQYCSKQAIEGEGEERRRGGEERRGEERRGGGRDKCRDREIMMKGGTEGRSTGSRDKTTFHNSEIAKTSKY